MNEGRPQIAFVDQPVLGINQYGELNLYCSVHRLLVGFPILSCCLSVQFPAVPRETLLIALA